MAWSGSASRWPRHLAALVLVTASAALGGVVSPSMAAPDPHDDPTCEFVPPHVERTGFVKQQGIGPKVRGHLSAFYYGDVICIRIRAGASDQLGTVGFRVTSKNDELGGGATGGRTEFRLLAKRGSTCHVRATVRIRRDQPMPSVYKATMDVPNCKAVGRFFL
jgi:hypothetical protein